MPGVVTVGCKLPHGLILQLQEKRTRPEPVMGGGFKDVDRWEKTGKAIKINGYAQRPDKAPETSLVASDGRGNAFALTRNVDADFFDHWLKQNADMDVVTRGMIFASARPGDVEGHAKEHKTERSGFERFDPENPVDEFKRKIKTAEKE